MNDFCYSYIGVELDFKKYNEMIEDLFQDKDELVLARLVLSMDLANKIAHKLRYIEDEIIKNYFENDLNNANAKKFCRDILYYVDIRKSIEAIEKDKEKDPKDKDKDKEEATKKLNNKIDDIKKYNIEEEKLKEFYCEWGDDVKYLFDQVNEAFSIKEGILTKVTKNRDNNRLSMLEEARMELWSFTS